MIRFNSFIFLVFLLIIGCTPSSKNTHSKNRFTLYIGPEPQTRDWNLSTGFIENTINMNVMEGLVSYDLDQESLMLKPQLARQFLGSENSKKWIFQIKKNVKWSDGVALTPQHFIDSFERVLNPSTASPHAHRLFPIKNAKAYYEGKVAFSKVGLSIEDKNVLVIDLEESFPEWPNTLTASFTFPIRKDLIKKHGPQWNQSKNIVSLGPYIDDKTSSGNKSCFQANPNYHGTKPQLTEFCFLWLDDKQTAQRLFEKNDIHLLKSPLRKELPPKIKNQFLVEGPGLGSYFLVFNFREDEKLDRPTRLFIKGILTQKSFEPVVLGDVTPSTSLVPNILLKSEKAQETSAAPPLNLPKLVLGSNRSELHQPLMENIQYLLKKNGFQVDLQLSPNAPYFESVRNENPYNLFRISWTPAHHTPYGYLEPFLSDSKNNFPAYKNLEFDSLVVRARQMNNPKNRARLYKKALNLLQERDLVIIPLFQTKQSFLLNKDWGNIKPHISQRLELKYFTVNQNKKTQ